MPNEVVKYHNDLNTVNMRGWTREEMNFMFAVLSKAKESGTDLIEFDRTQLTDLARYSERHKMRLHDVLKNLVNHVTEMKYIEESTHSYEVMNLFQRFKIQWNDDYSEMHATIRVSSEFDYVLNKLNANFTKFELEEFLDLRSTYSKQMYRLLKQWRTIGVKEWPLQDLKYLLSIPECYKASDIDKRVLKPIIKELTPIFKNLKVKPIKKRTKGNPIIAYEFKWKPETSGEWIEGKYQKKVTKSGKKSENSKLPDWYDNKPSTPPTEETRKALEKRLKRIQRSEKMETDSGEIVDQVVLFDD